MEMQKETKELSERNEKKCVALIAFYNAKALGVRYLETALQKQGYRVCTVFFKDFNSVRPRQATKEELNLLCGELARERPLLIGLSVMSSMYLDTVLAVINKLKKNFSVPLVCGGAFATMFPEYFLERGVEFVIRSDGEISLCQLADCVTSRTDYRYIPSLCYHLNGRDVINQIGNVASDLDQYGIPAVACENACFIENGTVSHGDPQLHTYSYEVVASRGCPFTCSYCCCINLRRLQPAGTRAVRYRTVRSVINELAMAKKVCRKLVFIHFYDEIFPNLPGWVDEFVRLYREEIGLPFTIWSHPKAVDAQTLTKLKQAGLTEVIMGIQSGSERIRRDVFHRYETQEEIIRATEMIHDARIFWASYDFMLEHPFETTEDIKETYLLVKQLCGRYELQIHGLNFLPGTDIVQMAIEGDYLTQKEMEDIMFAPMEKQFGTYWKLDKDSESKLWYQLTYCYQFRVLRRGCRKWEKDPIKYAGSLKRRYRAAQSMARARYLWKKAVVVLMSMRARLRSVKTNRKISSGINCKINSDM